ncbi:endospore germination permease [Paenibacillus sp. J5C_2022]|uniref:GerAB/ArcD/ProY family transporter n=1 Tax=Paenibacillus sp. J5C2022 TaxID=2977129 RepID=UPI0021D1DA21|nr:endospore germination permease [Paenibacillus sp. J5C2022]MCU6710374.1 endospore germination permease [Paenibacillus sp. J5C2022]
MLSNKKISVINAYFMLLLALGITNHVILIPLLLQTAGRDAWAGVILTMVLHTIWVFFLYFIMKRTNQQSISSWIKERCGSMAGWIFVIITAAYFFLMALIMLRETSTWIKVTYLPQTPKVVVLILLVLLSVYMAYNGIRSIAIISGILLPFVWVLGHFVAVTNLQFKDYSLLTPLFVNGYEPMLKSMIIAGGGFMELVVLIFIQHHMSRRVSYFSIGIMSIILAGLTLGPLMGAIANFGTEVAAQIRYPAYSQWKLVMITKYIAHLDFLALYQWLSGALIRMSLFMFIITDMLPPLMKKKHRLPFLLVLGVVMVGLALHSGVDRQIELYVLGKYSLVTFLFLITLIASMAITTALKLPRRR